MMRARSSGRSAGKGDTNTEFFTSPYKKKKKKENRSASSRGSMEAMTSISDHPFIEASCSFKLRIPSPNGVGTRPIFLELCSKVSLYCYDRLIWNKVQEQQTLSPRLSPSLIIAALSRYKAQTRLREKTK